jgi:hypothetical protein
LPKLRPRFQVTVNGNNIRTYVLPPAPVKIEFALAMEETQARLFSGLTAIEYMQLPGVPRYCDVDNPVSKSDVLAIYRLHHLIGAVQQDVNDKKAKRRK